jgi:hypothetical protein
LRGGAANPPVSDDECVIYRESSTIMAAAFSAIIAVGVLVFPDVIVGITEASATRILSMT